MLLSLSDIASTNSLGEGKQRRQEQEKEEGRGDMSRRKEEQEKLVILGAAGAESGTTEGGFCRSIALNENIGHALSSMQRLDEAQARFTSALELLRGQEKLASPEAWVESEMRGDVGGILLGLG